MIDNLERGTREMEKVTDTRGREIKQGSRVCWNPRNEEFVAERYSARYGTVTEVQPATGTVTVSFDRAEEVGVRTMLGKDLCID